MELSTKTFPSPIGVLYILMLDASFTKNVETMFPSPIGVLYILIGN